MANNGTVVATAIAGTTAAIIVAAENNRHQNNARLIVRVASDKTFHLNVLSTPDNGANWYVVKQVASAVITVDGATAGYVNAAEIDTPVGCETKVEIYNTGTAGNYVADWRKYFAGTQ